MTDDGPVNGRNVHPGKVRDRATPGDSREAIRSAGPDDPAFPQFHPSGLGFAGGMTMRQRYKLAAMELMSADEMMGGIIESANADGITIRRGLALMAGGIADAQVAEDADHDAKKEGKHG